MTKISCIKLKMSTTIECGENILDAFEKINIELPQGCRSGSCGVCVLEILSDKGQLSPANTIELNTLQRLYPQKIHENNLRLGCRAELQSDRKLEIKIKSNLDIN